MSDIDTARDLARAPHSVLTELAASWIDVTPDATELNMTAALLLDPEASLAMTTLRYGTDLGAKVRAYAKLADRAEAIAGPGDEDGEWASFALTTANMRLLVI